MFFVMSSVFLKNSGLAGFAPEFVSLPSENLTRF